MISILVDTSVWSEALRRKKKPIEARTGEIFLKSIIENNDIIILTGIIMQELLTGIKSENLFNEINEVLGGFTYLEPEKEDYVQAAQLKNKLKLKGISATAIDCLIASISINHNIFLATYDTDFTFISRYTNLKLLDFENYQKLKISV